MGIQTQCVFLWQDSESIHFWKDSAPQRTSTMRALQHHNAQTAKSTCNTQLFAMPIVFDAWFDERGGMMKNKRLYNGHTYT